jgi:hypothetical protein
MDAKEMEQLLREGAYAVLLEDDADAIKEFYEQVNSSSCVCDTVVAVGAVTEGTLLLHAKRCVGVCAVFWGNVLCGRPQRCCRNSYIRCCRNATRAGIVLRPLSAFSVLDHCDRATTVYTDVVSTVPTEFARRTSTTC